MNGARRDGTRGRFASKLTAGGTLRLMKWLVIIVLLILILMALFLPDRSLAISISSCLQETARGALTGRSSSRAQLAETCRPIASSTPSEKRIRTLSASISKGANMRASSQ